MVRRRGPHAIRRVLTAPGLAEAMTARCARLAPALTWTAVAASYRALTKSPLAASHSRAVTESIACLLQTAFTHLARPSDDTGLLEHARHAAARARIRSPQHGAPDHRNS